MGGSAANASHAATDLRKLCEIETYSPADNISEITATANDFGLDAIFVRSLQSAHMNSRDCLLVFSVGGGDEIRKISLSLINAVKLAKEVGSKVFSILGRANSFVNYNSDVSIVLPRDNDERVTPHSESLQAIVWHLLTCHPRLKTNKPTW
jgi:D-sedoheptulose 7-phosphate isomerase